jgi:hypothetical protein
VLVAGGYNDGDSTMAIAELYHPATRSWTTTRPMAVARQEHTATLLKNGEVLVAGGNSLRGEFLSSAELFR